jgi:hypothetical protein
VRLLSCRSIKAPVDSPPRVWLTIENNSVSSELLESAGRKFPRSNFLLSRTSGAHQAPVRTLPQRYPMSQVLHFLASTTTKPRLPLVQRSFPVASPCSLPPNSPPNYSGHPQPHFRAFMSLQCPATHHCAISCRRLLVHLLE